jgi:hypothetical protein
MRNVCIAGETGSGRSKLLVTTAAGFLGLTATAAAWTIDGRYALFFLAITVPIALGATLVWLREPARWELRALYRGQPVTLYASRDARVFNQVTRALRRAIEADRQPAHWDENDAA